MVTFTFDLMLSVPGATEAFTCGSNLSVPGATKFCMPGNSYPSPGRNGANLTDWPSAWPLANLGGCSPRSAWQIS